MATRRVRDPQAFADEAAAACERLLDRKATDVDWPASQSRRSVRVYLDDLTVIATRRKRPQRSMLEANVLKTLHEHGAPVPAVHAYDGVWLIQEYLAGERLPHALMDCEPARARDLLSSAAAGLAKIHRIGAETKLHGKVVRLGVADSWLRDLIDTPNRIGEALQAAAPDLDVDGLVNLLRAGEPCFLKWDARPGNAVVQDDGTIGWFDWEHCGARNALDDFAWLLADEYVPNVSGLADIAVANAPAEMSPAVAREYFLTYATFHTAVRLALVVHYKDDGDWWDEAMCLAEDKVRVTAAGAYALCARGAEFAIGTDRTAPLVRWFGVIAQRLGV
ncbi:MAG: hypothetical protein ABJ215_10480 [Alphaproteobacteria bacterium]